MHVLKNWLIGKKTYIIMTIILISSILECFNIYEIPEFVWAILGALGLGFIRIAIKGIKDGINKMENRS